MNASTKAGGISGSEDATVVVVQTLLAAGFEVYGAQRYPGYVEIPCDRESRLGPVIRYLVVLSPDEEFEAAARDAVNGAAAADGRLPVFVAAHSGPGQLGLSDFLDFFGGAVPSWQTLNESYETALRTAALNVVPTGMQGEAWLIFEDLVCAGLGFLFGRKANQFGGRTRGKRVSDILAQIPGRKVVVVDTKAYRDGFSADWSSLRALVEYVNRQKQRQANANEVYSALLVSSRFTQETGQLTELSRQFFSETQVPLCFLTSDLLAVMVRRFQENVDVRGSLNWRSLLAGGALQENHFEQELRRAADEKVKLEGG